MSKYYSLIAGLPDVTLEDTKLTYSVAEFKEVLAPILSRHDNKLVRWFFLKYDNANILLYLRSGSVNGFDERGVYTSDEIVELCNSLKNEKKIPPKMSVPKYIVEFLKQYYSRFEEKEEEEDVDDEEETPEYNILWEDKLSSLYFNEAMTCRDMFLALWFELNLNIGNVLAVWNCREYGLEKEEFIIGDNELAKQLRQTNTRDFTPDIENDYNNELMMIAEERDLFAREKRLDVLRWNWIEDNILYKTFDFVSVIAYLLRLEMIERWIGLNKVRGEKTFRELVGDMKRGSSDALEKFKENNK
jgi:hypothetical protein